MKKKYLKNPIFREVPINQIEADPLQPRGSENHGEDEEEEIGNDLKRLAASIQRYGIGEPIKVNQVEPNRHIVIDGHRRFRCARKLELETVPCLVYNHLTPAEFSGLQYELQNIRKPWKPLDRAQSFGRIKEDSGFKTNKELADHLYLSETLVANALQLYRYNLSYLGLMEKYQLPQSYRVEFIRLHPKMRKIREFEVDNIARKIFEKVKHKVITSAKDLRTLKRIFLRAATNEQPLYQFISNPDMTIENLEKSTTQSTLTLLLEQLTRELSEKGKNAIGLNPQEKELVAQAKSLLEKLL